MGRMYLCEQHSYGGNLPCPRCHGFQEGKAETIGMIQSQRDRYKEALLDVIEACHTKNPTLNGIESIVTKALLY